MSESNDKGKINLAEAIRKKLEQKKQQSSSKPGSTFQAGSAKPLKSQNNKSLTTNAVVLADLSIYLYLNINGCESLGETQPFIRSSCLIGWIRTLQIHNCFSLMYD